MKKHLMTYARNHRDTGLPACDTTSSALVVEGRDGTRNPRQVTCKRCRKTLAFQNHRKVVHFAIDGHDFCHTACGLTLNKMPEFITPRAGRRDKANCRNCQEVMLNRVGI